jgi:hypothetical protein
MCSENTGNVDSVPFPTWEDFLRLSFVEICFCGAISVQVMRRMNALINDLMAGGTRRAPPGAQTLGARLKAIIARSFADRKERLEASKEDRQGLGISRPVSTNS